MKRDENLARAGAYAEYDKWLKHNLIVGAVCLALGLFLAMFIWPMQMAFNGFGADIGFGARMAAIGDYFTYGFKGLFGLAEYSLHDVMFGKKLVGNKVVATGYYSQWMFLIKTKQLAAGTGLVGFILWGAVLILTLAIGVALNPHSKTPNIFGDARWATRKDIRDMGARNLVGFPDVAKLFVVGKFEDELVHMGETLSVLLLAPPGCQPAGSLVFMADGAARRIENVREGESVMSPGADGRMEPRRVLRTLSYDDRAIYRVSGAGTDVSYRCSDNHVVTFAKLESTGFVLLDAPVTELLRRPALLAAARLPVLREDGTFAYHPMTVLPEGRGRVHGFELDGGTQRYVTDGRIITHNTGKSVGFIVPSAVMLDKASCFFHDQKPELFDMTSGHRATIGPVFQLKWSAMDEPAGTWMTEEQAKLLCPDLIERDENDQPIVDEMGRYKTFPIFYPSWNPLSPKSIPAAGPKRDMYIERLVNVLCPDPTGGGDKFWTSKARAALIGLVHFLVAKVEHASDPSFQGSWTGIPEQWHGRECSFPMLVDWFAYAQMEFDDGSDDPMRQLFKAAIDEARRMDEDFARVWGNRVMNRAIVELTNLMNSPDKTRGSIIQTMDEAMGAFKNEAVRQRTAYSDFAFYELRGMPKPEAKEREMAKVAAAKKENKVYKPRYKKDEYQPISVYVSVSAEDAKAFATITGIFIDSANAYLVANGPNAIDDQGNQNGPYDFVFLIDEAPQLPKLDTVINGPAVGRSKRISYIIVGQDFGQFEQKYSKPEVETLKSTTAIKIILSQNNEGTAKQISEMAGRITYKKFSQSDKGEKNPFAALLGGKSNSESWESTEFLKPSFVMSMPPDKHVVLVQNYMNRPILADTPKFFLDKGLSAKVYNLREMAKNPIDFTGTAFGPAPTYPMPPELMDDAADRHASRSQNESVAAERAAALRDPRHVIIVTPRDIQCLTRDEFGEMAEKAAVYAAAEVFLQDGECFIEPPSPEQIMVTDRIEDIAAFVGKSRYFVFDEAQLESEVNGPLRAKGLAGLDPEFAEYVSRRAVDVGETPGHDIYFLGYQGGASLDLPESADAVTPPFTVRWVVEILSFIMGIEEQKKLFEL